MKFKNCLFEISGDFNGKKSLKNFLTSYFFNPSFRVLLNHRLGKWFYSSDYILLKAIGKRYKYLLVKKRACDFSYTSKIGKRLSLPHPIGIVIGANVVIKDNVKIFQHVTLGSHGKKGIEMSYPVINDNVTIFANSIVLGSVEIGANSVIGANTLVNVNVPENSIVVGNPCRVVSKL